MASSFLLSSSIVTVFIVFLFLNVSVYGDPTQDLIDKICKQTEDYGYCNRVFHESLKSPSTDAHGLAQIAIDLSTQNATSIYNYIKPILDKATDPEVKRILGECVSDYQQIMQAFQGATSDFNAGNYQAMVGKMKRAPSAVSLCDGAIGSSTPALPVHPYYFLIDRNKQMRILIAMSLASGQSLGS